jgi:hypothetical protein
VTAVPVVPLAGPLTLAVKARAAIVTVDDAVSVWEFALVDVTDIVYVPLAL